MGKINMKQLREDLSKETVTPMRSFSRRNHWGGTHSPGYAGKLTATRVRVSRDGYAPNGKYFGRGEPVFEIESDGPEVDFFVRAADRENALREAHTCYPEAEL